MVNKKIPLFEITRTFLMIGTIGFGGGLAIIAFIQEVCVNRKKWLNIDEFSHGITLSQFLGTFAVNTTIFVGYRMRGLKGALTALISFLAPSVVFVICLSALYMNFNKLPALQSALKGITPVVIALILSAAYQIGKERIKNLEAVVLMILAIVLSAVFNIQVILILVAALIYGFLRIRGVNSEK